jgi:multidrug efflux pump subunit AcrA (membrane-fusion protein)
MYQFLPVLIVAALCVCAPFSIEAAQDSTRSGQKPASVGHSESADDKLLDDVAGAVEQAVIHPFQSANVGSEVGGVVQTVLFHEGDRVNQGDVVAVMFDERELIQVRKVREKLTGLRLELKKAEIDLKIKEELVALGVATRLELEKAVSEAEVAAQRIRETSEELLAAEINLKACNIRAPFTGYVAVRYKQPFETVERLEKVFAVLDASKE